MTFPLIAFFLWLVSTDTFAPGNPAAQFIKLANIQDSGAKSLLMNVGSKLPTDGSIQKAHDAFAYWRWYFAQPGIGLYPKSCTVDASQVNAIANLSTQFQLRAPAVQANSSDATPPAGIALFLLAISTPNYLDSTQVCNAYACGVVCAADLNYTAFQTALQSATLITKIDTARAFYQQYLQILTGLSVDTNSYPGGWVCAIKVLSLLTSTDAASRTSKQH